MGRVPLVTVDERIPSAYGRPLAALTQGRGRLTPDAARALVTLYERLSCFGRGLVVSDCWRDVETQRKARERYDRWVAAGKPATSSSAFDPSTMKPAFVALPGRSYHCAGRAIDLDVLALVPKAVPTANRGAEWRAVRAAIRSAGWTPITPDSAGPDASEAWHHEYRGPWGILHDGTPPDVGYEAAAFGATLDSCEDSDRAKLDPTGWCEIQAHLHRAGHDAGPIDGRPGSRTTSAIVAAGIPSGTAAAVLQCARALPDRVP
jgi:D-alanyl-D-alanine dipeptidase